MNRQSSDSFVRKARQEGFISRAAYKLLEIDDEFKLFNSRTKVCVDLGAAPGGWCQVISQRTNPECLLIAVDLLSLQVQIPGAHFIHGDFTSLETQKQLLRALPSTEDQTTLHRVINVVVSDMSPNRAGNSLTDQNKITELNRKAFSFAIDKLRLGGHFVCKVLGSRPAYVDLYDEAKSRFRLVRNFKPKASREVSQESYLVCSCYDPSIQSFDRQLKREGDRFGLDDWPGASSFRSGR